MEDLEPPRRTASQVHDIVKGLYIQVVAVYKASMEQVCLSCMPRKHAAHAAHAAPHRATPHHAALCMPTCARARTGAVVVP